MYFMHIALNFRIKLPQFTGPLKENDLLAKTEHLFKGEIRGPESIAYHNGDLYSALADGRIIRIKDKKFTVVADISEGQCEGLWQQMKCGRGLGLKFDKKGLLYVVDAYFGLKRVDIPGGKGAVTTIFSTKTKVDGKAPLFLDDVAVLEGAGSKGGNVYFLSDASMKWPVEDVIYSFVEHEKSGRIIRYDEDANKATVAAGGLGFPNGLELNDAKDALLICEFTTRRILKLHLKGSKAGTVEPILENLPGEPDNIRRSSDPKKETYWVAIAMARNASNPDILDILSNKPFLRKAAFRLIHAVGSSLQYLGNLSEYIPLKEIGYKVKSGELLFSFLKHRGLLIEIDAKGTILRALHSPDGRTTVSSEAREVVEGNKKVLYIGSYFNDYIGRVAIN
ncbi:adipocyte plasma membrane-associated protein-like protein [Leptotrombidium deliense]|uniref:Adipocyte plasma membrane-associated protein-like protein n=1 Tax=Leptotrombidium deliense TaxID=299467 RepID=A0A443S6L4_9ACAR|nr:adipocyte plasma membrane-associated protein-like protein [Leptotrombidium deliense]